MGFGDTTGQFRGCIDLAITATGKPSLEGTTSLGNAFRGCVKIETVPGMESWNTANVTDMSRMFRGAYAFNGDLSGWNTANVTDMSRMFSDTDAFNQDISGWNTENVTDMEEMFKNAETFNQNISGWTLYLLTRHDDIFTGASAMEEKNKPPRFR